MKVINVVGAHQHFMKIAPLIRQLRIHSDNEPLLVYTGQHYDERMAELFFNDLQIPTPDVYHLRWGLVHMLTSQGK